MKFFGKVRQELLPAWFVARGEGFSVEVPAEPCDEEAEPAPGWALVAAQQDVVEAAARDAGWTGRDGFELLFVARHNVLGRRLVPPAAPAASARVEEASETRIGGWAEPAGDGSGPALLDVVVNGEFYQRLLADRRRDDLKLAGATEGSAGFETSLLLASSTDGEQIEIMDTRTGQPLDRPAPIRGLPGRRIDAARDHLAASIIRLRAAAVSIVVPVLSGEGLPAGFLEHLGRNTTHPARIILVLDPALDASSAARAAEFARDVPAEILAPSAPLDLGTAINLGLRAAGRDDAVLLMPCVHVGPRWLQRLLFAAHMGPDVASASAATGMPGRVPPGPPVGMPEGWRTDDLARLATHASGGIFPRIPAFGPACAYLRRDALDRIGDLDAETFADGDALSADWSMRCSYQGLTQVLDEGLLVLGTPGDRRDNAAESGPEQAVIDRRYGEFSGLLDRLAASPEQATAGHRFRLALRRAAAPPRPRCLFVISTQTGGTPQTNRDLMAALEDRYDPLLLQSDGRTLTLSRFSQGEVSLLARHELAVPIEPVPHRSPEYDDIVGEWMSGHAVELLHVRHLAWHGFGLVEAARRRGIPVVMSFHDFYLACPTVKLLDASLTHCAAVCTQGETDCRPELWRQDQFPFLRDRWVYNWREMAGPVLDACDVFVTTSPSARNLMVRAFPRLGQRDFRIIPHGRDFTGMDTEISTPHLAERPLRILIPGNLGRAKGAYLLRELLELDTEGLLEFHIAGNVDSSLKGARAVLHGPFEREELPGIVSRIRPHLAAILSIWPETYSHTLTEMWAMGVPVLAFDLGAPGDRIRTSGAGWLLSEVSAAAVHGLLLSIAGDGAGYVDRRQAAEAWRRGEGRRQNVRAMSDAYDALYQDAIARRRPFGPPAGAGAGISPPRR